MRIQLGLTIITSALIVALLAAQDEPVPKEQPATKKDRQKKKDLPEIRDLEKKPPTEPATGEDVKKIIERLNKNMDSSEERLNKKDPGDDTRKVQGDIIKDLDELIKQQSQGGGGSGGGGSASASSQQGKGGKGSSSGSSSGADPSGSSAKGGGRSKGRSQANNKNSQGGSKGNQSKGDQAKATDSQKQAGPDKLGKNNGDSKDKGKQTAKAEPGKEGKDGGGMGGNKNPQSKKDNTTIGDLFKDVWGHLPLNKRQEMDAYARERFLPKYDEILRQYYRTISEQGRRKDSE